MATITVPELNLAYSHAWSPYQKDLYAQLPLTLEKYDVIRRKPMSNWKKMFKTISSWEANAGAEQKLVIAEPSPIKRQHAFGDDFFGQPTIDRPQVGERLVPKVIKQHAFQAGPFQWTSSFKDFIVGKVKENYSMLVRDQEYFGLLFLRSFMLHQSPHILFCNATGGAGIPAGGFDDGAPIGLGNETGTSGKTNDYLKAGAKLMGSSGILSISNLQYALDILSNDLGAQPYQSGSAKDDMSLNDKYMLLCSGEAYSQLVNDPYYRENRPESEDPMRDGFRGPICGGRIMASFHDLPLRFSVATAQNGALTWPEPETVVVSSGADNYGQTIRNPAYAKADYEIAFLCGQSGYGTVGTGAPPAEFRQAGMEWNGAPKLITDFLIPSDSAPGGVQTNFEKKWLMWWASATYGACKVDGRQVLPIVFKRTRGLRSILR